MNPVFAVASNITTSIGLTTEEVWNAVAAGKSGVTRNEDPAVSAVTFWGSRMDAAAWNHICEQTAAFRNLSLFERMCVYSAQAALKNDPLPATGRTVLILATTKGNIEALAEGNDPRNLLSTSASLIGRALNLSSDPIVISHACVSGVTALITAMRLLQGARYDHAIVVGADRFTRFVLSGFQSFQAVAGDRCRPFDAARRGINLGEAAATIVLSTKSPEDGLARLCGGATTNDANHISGPSRTGEELSMAIGRALEEARVSPDAVQAISAHGTATSYNDEMEAKAFAHAGLLHAAVHSMKGYVGHTLGAAGVLESAMVIESLRRQLLIPSLGYATHGVSEPIQVTTRLAAAPIDYILKTASGFGGCNAAAVWGSK